jgi:hypothetical protein
LRQVVTMLQLSDGEFAVQTCDKNNCKASSNLK